MNKVKADYIYKFQKYINELIIEDLNLGRMSVTNCIEDVVEEICKKENIDPECVMIIYKDSDNTWDGWNHKDQNFVILNAFDEKEALIKMEAHKQRN